MASDADRIDRDWIERKQALDAAKARGDIEYLMRALTDPDHRGRAALALADLDANESVDAIARLLDAADSSTRSDAAHALGRLDARDALPRLRELAFGDHDDTVRMTAAAALVDLGDRDAAVRANIELLSSSSLWARGNAAYQLDRLGDTRALEPLETARPRLFGSPREWVVFNGVFRSAIAGLRRRAAGKEPRRWPRTRWARWLRWIGCVVALLALYEVFRLLTGPWLAAPLAAMSVLTLTFVFPAPPRARSTER